ncbi:hypothetical protein Q4491_14960 [Photobacterium sp. 2_MG-2023]|uniref:hypothetical protein n=1 Tax=Photobacterium TaxID=657 RepID=UPI0026E3ADCE|nr:MULTISPECIES: hypothetical protein [Photobacterium]MDO6582645.1 hypothetical protein [Photobacterium sp. 2_MG-2023]
MARNQIALDVPCIAKVEIRRLSDLHFRTLLVPQGQSMSSCEHKRPHQSLTTQVTRKWQYPVNTVRNKMEGQA